MGDVRKYSRRLTNAIIKIDNIEYAIDSDNTVSNSELCLMYALDDEIPHSQKQIAQQWGISRTTLNTIVKKWEREGLLVLNKISGKRCEKEICLTEKGSQKAKNVLKINYAAEDGALQKTIEKYSDTFIEALEYYAEALEAEYDNIK